MVKERKKVVEGKERKMERKKKIKKKGKRGINLKRGRAREGHLAVLK